MKSFSLLLFYVAFLFENSVHSAPTGVCRFGMKKSTDTDPTPMGVYQAHFKPTSRTPPFITGSVAITVVKGPAAEALSTLLEAVQNTMVQPDEPRLSPNKHVFEYEDSPGVFKDVVLSLPDDKIAAGIFNCGYRERDSNQQT